MSEELGPRSFGGSTGGQVFLGRDMNRERNFSEATSAKIDEEVQELIKNSYTQAMLILTDHQDVLDACAVALLERETLTAKDVDILIAGEELPPYQKPEDPKQSTTDDSEQEKIGG